MRPYVSIVRTEGDRFGTFGVLGVDGRAICWSMEREWDMNAPNESCISVGQYDLRLVPSSAVTRSTRGKWTHTYEVVDPRSGRSLVRFHPANFPDQLEGCIATGKQKGTIRGKRGVQKSAAAFDMFMTAMSGARDGRLTVRECYV